MVEFTACNLVEEHVPILYGSPVNGKWVVRNDISTTVHIDILGSIFFLLSGYEEVVSSKRDKHARFPAKASIPYRCGFLERPMVDEYAEILWSLMQERWPWLERKQREGRVWVTCDVDHPYDLSGQSFHRMLRRIAGDLKRRENIGLLLRHWQNYWARRKDNYDKDPNNTFDFIMTTCEENGLRATFLFIPDHTEQALDGFYSLEEPFIQSLITRILQRGHEVGAHGSYNSYLDCAQILREKAAISRYVEQSAPHSVVRCNRQHFLRWNMIETPHCLEQARYEVDSTGGYADHPGFRFGTSRAFPLWNWKHRRGCTTIEQPLILMDGSLFGQHLNLGLSKEADLLAQRLKKRALQYGGTFTLLWHNSELKTRKARTFFERLVVTDRPDIFSSPTRRRS